MAEIVISIVSKVAEYLVFPISQGAGYIFCFKQFIGDVEKAKQELGVKLADVKKRKDEADRKTEEIMPSVKRWLDDVKAILEEVRKLQLELQGGGNKCFNVSLRYSLAKQMENKAKQMMDLKNNSNFEPFSLPTQLPSIVTHFSSKDFMDFDSRKSTYNHLLEAIKDGKNKIVGLYGMAGSGKTTLAKEVGKKVDGLKLFDKVVMAVISKPPNIFNIQQEIAEQVGLEFRQETTQFTRAQRLSSGLKSKRVLIILDDVWSKLCLEQIGIPINEGCCVLLTTRHHNVCVSMDCESIIELHLLTEEEAWALFKMLTKTTNVSMNEFDSIGKEIVNECKGLLIAIVTVASALKGKSIDEWRSTLRRLQHPPPLDIEADLKTPYTTIEVSYDNLPSPLAKSLFLLCSIFPEDHEIHIEDLIRFGKGTLELGDNIYTMEEARNEILVTTQKLLDSCLLMHANMHACVKLHDVVRDVALWIGKKRCQEVLVDSNAVSNTLVSNHQSLKDTKALSLWNVDENFKLSNQLGCPTLEILLLQPHGFVEDLRAIEALKVLALITYGFTWSLRFIFRSFCSVPRSIVSSTNLNTLCLRGKVLHDISFLSELKGLEILDLRDSCFLELPAGIVDMKMLKLLDMFGCKIDKSPLEVIGRCEQLEELYFYDHESAIPETFCRSRLKRYAICDSTIVSKYMPPFAKYLDGCDEGLRYLCIQGFKVSALSLSMKDLILRANCLWLENCWWEHKDINFEITHLGVSCCLEKRFIIDNLQTQHVFSHLIMLTLIKMNSLEQVFQDSSVSYSLCELQELCIQSCPELRTCIFTHATVNSLPKLRKLEIVDCNKVKWLFSYSLTFHCPSLGELKISKCSELERLIAEEAAHEDPLLHDIQDCPYGHEIDRAYVGVTLKSFNQLQNQQPSLFFLRLKALSITSSGRKKCIFEIQIKNIIEDGESIKAKEPFKLNSELHTLDLQYLPQLEYICKGPTQIVSFHRLKYVTLRGCPRLKNIFTLAIVASLPELSTLKVFGCNEWEGIFCEESLKNLSSSSSSNVCFPKLQRITISDCNKLRWLLSYSLASHCPSLENLSIDCCSQFERIVDKEAAHSGERLLHQRESLDDMQDYPYGNESDRAYVGVTLKSFNQLQNQHPLLLFLRLKDLSIIRSGGKKGIFEVQVKKIIEDEESIKAKEPLKLNSELHTLDLQYLPQLEYICKGPTQIVSFHRLKYVTLRGCPRLKNIFTLAIVASFPELSTLKVFGCNEWEGIFCEESLKNLSSSSSNICFPKLQKITISDCNKLRWLLSYSLASHCPSLENLSIDCCSQFERIVDKEAAHSGERLLHQRESLDDMQDYPYGNKNDRAYVGFILKSFNQLQNQQPLILFLRLEYLSITSNGKKKGIFEVQVKKTIEDEESIKAKEPLKLNAELYILGLQDLPQLEYICKGPTQFVSFHRLKYVTLRGCPRLKNIFTLAIVASLPELSTLDVIECNEWEGIFCEESLKNLSSSSSSNVCFPKLMHIEISECHKVRRVFSYSLASHCPSLEEIDIRDCAQLEGVVQTYESEVAGRDENLFPKLNTLNLISLPKLREIYLSYEFNLVSNTMLIRDCPNIRNIPLECKASSGTYVVTLFLNKQPNITCSLSF